MTNIRNISLPLAVAGASFISSPLLATVNGVSALTEDGNYNLTSITIGGTQYTDLTGSDADVVWVSGGAYAAWISDTADVASPAEVNPNVSGLNYRVVATGVGAGSEFQFGRVIEASDQIFIMDWGLGDPLDLELVDSSGLAVGDYTLSLTAGQYGGALVSNIATFDLLLNGGTSISRDNAFNQSAVAVAFSFTDFTENTAGDLSQVTGIRLTSNSGLDVAMVGLATIPEPSASATLFGMAVVLFVCVSRRKR